MNKDIKQEESNESEEVCVKKEEKLTKSYIGAFENFLLGLDKNKPNNNEEHSHTIKEEEELCPETYGDNNGIISPDLGEFESSLLNENIKRDFEAVNEDIDDLPSKDLIITSCETINNEAFNKCFDETILEESDDSNDTVAKSSSIEDFKGNETIIV